MSISNSIVAYRIDIRDRSTNRISQMSNELSLPVLSLRSLYLALTD